ncbi:hypothetical protein P12x_004981 [Tundrisphaera lichenicola]|uniref:hypothetical protein n=1 Tax=Tundrisphaera lichenicola TaxID=2029860 RepID=UPI003EBDE1B8
MPSDHDSASHRSGLMSDVADLEQVALRDRWGLGLIAVGWAHLVVFSVCQVLYGRGDRAPVHFLPLWGVDLIAAFLIARKFLVGESKRPTPSLLLVVARVWITFLILAFSTASMNSLVGFETDWFKAVWATLATFGFATMAWIFHLGFLIPAVQMSLTALLIARNPDYAYLIYGVSWCLALNGVGAVLERRGAIARGDLMGRTSEARPVRRSA